MTSAQVRSPPSPARRGSLDERLETLARVFAEDPSNFCVASLARAAKIPRSTVYYLLADPDNRSWFWRRTEQLFAGVLPFLWARILTQALDGDMRAARMFVDRWDPAWKKQQVLAHGTNIFQAIQAMSDGELRRWIELKRRTITDEAPGDA